MLRRTPDDRSSLPQDSTGNPAAGNWRPPGGYAQSSAWALENRAALEQYAERNQREGTAAEQLERFLTGHPELLNGGHAQI